MSCFSFLRGKKQNFVSDEKVHTAVDRASTLVDDDASWAAATSKAPTVKSTPTSKQLNALRDEMRKEGLDWYIVFSDDEHASEYTAPPEQRRAFLTGFTGSAGTAIVKAGDASEAHCFADGRYWVQAGEQLDENWTLHKVGLGGEDNWDGFIAKAVRKGEKVGFDAKTISYGERRLSYASQSHAKHTEACCIRYAFADPAKSLISSLQGAGAELTLPERNLVDAVWPDRPSPRIAVLHEHPLEFAGKHASEKLKDLHKWNLTQLEALAPKAKENDNDAPPAAATYLISALDEVAWTLNLRGDSIPNNPVFPAYLTVTSRAGQPHPFVTLYVSLDLVPRGSQVDHYIHSLGVRILPHDDLWDALKDASDKGIGSNALIASEKVSWAVMQAFAGGEKSARVLGPDSPVAMAKAIKNPTEIKGMKHAYLHDGAAWCIWMAHLTHDIRKRGAKISEWEAAERLDAERKKLDYYAGNSYDPISATGEHAALPHYETPEKGSSIIDKHTPYLMDAGAQYFNGGTIDTTRTVNFGSPAREHKRAFTRVLQGHIAIDTLVFPEGSTGSALDAIARRALWQDGMNYSHGT